MFFSLPERNCDYSQWCSRELIELHIQYAYADLPRTERKIKIKEDVERCYKLWTHRDNIKAFWDKHKATFGRQHGDPKEHELGELELQYEKDARPFKSRKAEGGIH